MPLSSSVLNRVPPPGEATAGGLCVCMWLAPILWEHRVRVVSTPWSSLLAPRKGRQGCCTRGPAQAALGTRVAPLSSRTLPVGVRLGWPGLWPCLPASRYAGVRHSSRAGEPFPPRHPGVAFSHVFYQDLRASLRRRFVC